MFAHGNDPMSYELSKHRHRHLLEEEDRARLGNSLSQGGVGPHGFIRLWRLGLDAFGGVLILSGHWLKAKAPSA